MSARLRRGSSRASTRSRSRADRGAAVVELALVVPVLVLMLLFSIYLADLARARLKLHEAARYAAFEMTSHVLDDYGANDHALAFERAREKTLADVSARFADLESIDAVPAETLGMGFSAVQASIEPAEAALADVPLEKAGGVGEAVSAVAGGARWVTGRFGFNPGGRVTVRVRATAHDRILPQRYLDGEAGFFTVSPSGGVDLASRPIESRYTLVASAWYLPDGADATFGPKRTGVRRSGGDTGLRLQVDRMKLFGTGPFLGKLGNVAGLRSLLGFSLPDPDGTFVVSHNYSNDPLVVRDVGERGCGGEVHTAKAGLANLARAPGLDVQALRCFDTAPFRDTHEYADSLYKQLFDARGPHFMGCKQAMADDPARAGNHAGDLNTQKVDCL